MTPAETDMAIEAMIWRDKQQERQGLQLAWLTAALGRAKKMPTLQRLMTPPARRLHGPELQKRRGEHRRMANEANVAAINRHMMKRRKTAVGKENNGD